MDMFMDKLAQKLNAQEIIKANTTAETEEMNRLKNQIAEYHACLERLKKLVEAGEAAVGNAQESREDMERLTEASIQKIRDIQKETAGLQELGARLERLEKGLAELGRNSEETARAVRTTEKNLRERLESLGTAEKNLPSRLEEISAATGKNIQDRLESISAAADETVHKECVKVYRNVQAVVTEESEKQGKAAEETVAAVKRISGKIGTVLGISVAALIFSLAGFALQLLNLLNIKIF
ncbi:MAG: hypothetical protein NC432_15715 [Roseburia sp.]|nr:hypothetical protein [Roseburia sp.]MCM1099575.1 hypothetical protein [Ruminococcus flavefaciens]